MKFEIKHWLTGKVLFECEAGSLKLAVEMAVGQNTDLSGADLRDADLSDAVLRDADLRDADLRGAVLRDAVLSGAVLSGADLRDARLGTGETWTEYLTETVPALLVAGGKALESFAEHFQCHNWNNCPMAHAFGCKNIEGVPVLYRPRAEQFVTLFDNGLIPWPLPTKEQLEKGAVPA